MGYLSPGEFESFGLSAATPEAVVETASSLMDAHCRRKSLGVAPYTERLRVGCSGVVRLTYLPLCPAEGAAFSVVSARGRYGVPSQCECALGTELTRAFSLMGTWVELDPASLDLDPRTGEVRFGTGALGLRFDEVEITYTAGVEPVPDSVKHACAMIVRNVQATPALTVRGAGVDQLHMEYFSDSLLDSNVRKLLAPFVAQKVG